MNPVKPPRLRPGDLIGLVAPASPPGTEEKIEKGVAYLERLGYRVTLGKHLRCVEGYLAGADEERAADFNAMVRDNAVKAIFAVRGGYGTPRILELIDYRALKANPKIIVGYSDITALQLAVLRKTGLVTFSGPMPGVEMYRGLDRYTEESFWRQITSSKKIGRLENPAGKPLRALNPGRARGILAGGNLSLLAGILGTPYQPDFRRAILFFEEVGEPPHRVDRMLSQLLNAGILRNAAGVIFGQFTDCIPSDPGEPFLPIDRIQEDYAAKITAPAAANFFYGHIPQKLTVPIGLRAAIDPEQNRIEVLEGGVR